MTFLHWPWVLAKKDSSLSSLGSLGNIVNIFGYLKIYAAVFEKNQF
jgi:hypothetical protein